MANPDNSSKRKYLLYSKDDGRSDAEKPCAFFNSPAGCRSGATCRFMHGSTPNFKPADTSAAAPVPVRPQPVAPAPMAQRPQPYNAVAPPPPPPMQPPPPSSDKHKREDKASKKNRASQDSQHPSFRDSAPPTAVQSNTYAHQDYYRPVPVVEPAAVCPPPAYIAPPLPSRQPTANHQNARNVNPVSGRNGQMDTAGHPANGKSKRKSYDPAESDEDDEQFLFGVVNHALQGSPGNPYLFQGGSAAAPAASNGTSASARIHNHQQQQQHQQVTAKPPTNVHHNQIIHPSSIHSNSNSHSHPPQQQQQQQHQQQIQQQRAVAPMDSSSPFVPNASVMRILSSSGTDHATLGVDRKKAKSNHPTATVTAATSSHQQIQIQQQQQQPLEVSSSPVRSMVAPANANTSSTNSNTNSNVKPLPTNLPALPWGQLVVKTKANSKFAKDYNFEAGSVGDGSWIKAKPFGDWCAQRNLPPIIAIDCEMCETTDPVDGTKFGNTLIRLSVINALNPTEVLFDSLVAPGLPITDMRTDIHGIKEEDVRSVTFTLRHAQAALLNLCHENTIIVGHSLQNDLRALHFIHTTVIDTSYLYSVESSTEPGVATTLLPSLREIAELILGNKLPDTHDSVQDARTAVQAAAYVLQYGPQPAIVRQRQSVPGVELTLLVHRIPDSFTEPIIQNLFTAQCCVVPTLVTLIGGTAGPDDGGKANLKATVTFMTKEHADLAFESISGPVRVDKGHLPQKRVYLKGGGYCCVRKNVV